MIEMLWNAVHHVLTSIGAFTVALLLFVVGDAAIRRFVQWRRGKP